MAEATLTPVRAGTGDLRIVFFGLKSAGKSSLLGALAQAAQTQEKYLKGQVIDRSEGRLAALHQRLFEDAPEQTEDDIVLYPLQYRPLTPTGPGPARNVVVYDCNGQSASDILMMQQFDGNARRKALMRALVDADTVLLIVDGSDKPSQLERDFAQFANFLRLFEESRAGHGDVGGLPVYLVLTKCDLLAQPNDTAGAWIQRIEERKRAVAQRFQKFMSKQADPSFGKVNLHLWATAIHRPALTDRPAKSVEPFGVADLFRQCLQSAMNYNAVRQQSHRRLQFTLLGVAALVLVMAALALAFYLGRPPEGLEKLIQQAEMEAPAVGATMSDRVDARDSERRSEQLKKLMLDPNFVKLPKDLQQRVNTYVKDVEEYERLKDKYTEVRVSPALIADAEELKRARERVEAFKLPENFAGTNLAKLKENLQKELTTFSDAVDKELAWYEKFIDDGKLLLNVNPFALRQKGMEQERKDWLAKVDAYMNASSQDPPYGNSDKLLPGAATVQQKTVYEFPNVVQARDRLEKTRQGLLALRKLVE